MKKLIILMLVLLMPLSALAERVVSLYGSYAEAWLQAGGTLAGVTDDAVRERGLDVGDAQIIGTTKMPNLELILALEPDWVILNADIAPQMQAKTVLEAAGVECTAFRVDTWRDYAAMMDEMTVRTDRRDLYESIIPPMEREITVLTEKTAEKKGPKILLLRAYSGGAKVKGTDNLAGVMLADLGCVNVVDLHPSLLEEMSLEAIITEDPEWIFVTVMGTNEEDALDAVETAIAENPACRGITAVQRGHIQVLPTGLFHYKPNARWAESYRYLYEILYPEQETP